jgi:Kef-type K+ transport system membrane component KefB
VGTVDSTWLGLLALSGVAAGGLLLAKVIARWDLPEVLAYLVVGIVLGPEVLGILNINLLERSAFLPQLLLGFVAFMLGEFLTPRALLSRKTLPTETALLSVLLPCAAVVAGAIFLVGAPTREAITLGILAMAGAPATVLALRQSLGDQSARGGLLATLSAVDNLLVVLLYGTVAPFLVASVAQEWSLASALREVLMTVGVGVLLGLLGSWSLGLLRAGAREDVGLSLAGALIVVVALAASSQLLGASTLVACAVAGIGTAVADERHPGRAKAFEGLRVLERIVYVFFFVFAGTEIVFGHLAAAGILALIYIVARALGKVLAALLGGFISQRPPRDSLAFGVALLPQAGVVVGLALDASARFPYVGADILAVVMAALIVFELVGPFGVQRALRMGASSQEGRGPSNASPDAKEQSS